VFSAPTQRSPRAPVVLSAADEPLRFLETLRRIQKVF
jgi:hypothetical protein